MIDKYNLEYLRKDGRVKTVRLRGYVSQGLILPVPSSNLNEGDDVANLLGITKYEPAAPKYQSNYGKKTSKKVVNPFFEKCTSPNNVKYYPEVFKEGDLVVVTEKIHGTSWRAGTLPKTSKTLWSKIVAALQKAVGRYNAYEFVYGSHNVQITHNNRYKGFYGSDVYGKVAKKYNATQIPADYTVFGEAYGEGIQDLDYGVKGDIDLMVFDVKYKGDFLPYDEMLAFCARYGLPTVPLLYKGLYYKGLVEEHTDGKTTLAAAPKQIREGCVIKSANEINDVRIGRKMLKSISVNYLLRADGTEFH